MAGSLHVAHARVATGQSAQRALSPRPSPRDDRQPDALDVFAHDAPVTLLLGRLLFVVAGRVGEEERDAAPVRRPAGSGRAALVVGERFRLSAVDPDTPQIGLGVLVRAPCRDEHDPLAVSRIRATDR
jgi:hypothetical protein